VACRSIKCIQPNLCNSTDSKRFKCDIDSVESDVDGEVQTPSKIRFGVDEDHGANHDKTYKDRGELEKAYPGISAFLEVENQQDAATLLDRRGCLVKIMNLNRDKYMLSYFKIRLENESATRLEQINTLTDELDLLKSKLVVAEEKVVKVELKLRTIGAARNAGKDNVVNKELVALGSQGCSLDDVQVHPVR